MCSVHIISFRLFAGDAKPFFERFCVTCPLSFPKLHKSGKGIIFHKTKKPHVQIISGTNDYSPRYHPFYLFKALYHILTPVITDSAICPGNNAPDASESTRSVSALFRSEARGCSSSAFGHRALTVPGSLYVLPGGILFPSLPLYLLYAIFPRLSRGYAKLC